MRKSKEFVIYLLCSNWKITSSLEQTWDWIFSLCTMYKNSKVFLSSGIFEQQDKAFCSVYSNLLLISWVNQLIKVNYIIVHKIQWLTGMYSQINTLASFLPHAAPQGEFLSSAFKLWLNTIDLEHVVIQMIIRTGLQVRLRSVWTSGWEFLKDNASSRTSEPLQAVVHYTNYLINSITPLRGSSLATKPGRKYCSGKNDTEMKIFL